MKVPKRRSRKLAAIDAEIEAKASEIIARMDASRAHVEQVLAEARLKSHAARLAKEPDYFGLTMDEALAVAKAKLRYAQAETDAERRAAKVEELSIVRMPVRKIAEQLGLSYYYVVELRRKLGVSQTRTRKP